MNLKIFLLFISAMLLAGCNKHLLLEGGFYEFDPVEVELTGTLDSAEVLSSGTERYQLIKLDKPINIKEKEAGKDTEEVRKNVSWIQLIIDFAVIEYTDIVPNQKVSVKGTLFQPAHDKNAPVQMKVQEMKKAK